MKYSFYVLIIFSLFSCNNEQNETSQGQEAISQIEQVIQQEISLDENISQTGLFNYDKSKLIFQPVQILPVDESKQNASLRKTLDNLLIIIDNKDVDGLVPFLDKDISVSFGEDDGIESFITFWNLDLNPDESMVWDVLKTTISLGGTFGEGNKNAYFTPYVFTNFFEDPFEFGLIIGNKVNIRSAPNLKGKVVRQLTHEIVQLVTYDKPFDTRTQTIGNETHDWLKIKMADGETGYVWGKFFRSPIDYRACFAKVRDEGWKMTCFIAGD